MKGSQYLFVIIFFFAFLTLLLIFVTPLTMGNAKITGFFSSQDGTTHYTQVPEGTNASAYVTIDNSRVNAHDLINYSFKATIYADFVLATDGEIITQEWIGNFTLLKGNDLTIKLTFNTSIEDLYPGKELREFYLQVCWGPEDVCIEYHYLTGLNVGLTYKTGSPFNIKTLMVIFSAIGMGAMILIITIALKKDISRRLRRRRPPRTPVATLPAVEEIPPSLRAPTEPTTPETPPTETMELIPCPQCGTKIDRTQIICPNCGNELPKCVVCNLIIDEDEPIETCPECGAVGHRAHFREWVHVKGSCPICKKPLSF